MSDNSNANDGSNTGAGLTTEQERGEDQEGQNESLDNNNTVRMGTISSARFNILATMVGGGSLSLPLAFQKSGNGLLGPLILVLAAFVTEFCFVVHVQSARILSPLNGRTTSRTVRGKDSFESIAGAAFGPSAYVFSKGLVTAMCFFGTVGYAVLLRDMLQPLTDWVFTSLLSYNTDGPLQPGPSFPNNASMLTVVLLVTPLCTLETLTSLERFGAASMFSVLILGSCIVYRSLQCNVWDNGFHNNSNNNNNNTTNTTFTEEDELFSSSSTSSSGYYGTAFQLWPRVWKDVLDAFPLFVSCFVCHYNLAPVQNELAAPTTTRVRWWLRSTVGSASLFYLMMGVAGSTYGHCAATTTDDNDNPKFHPLHGNVLLDFDENDPLLLIGRTCLAITITLAFPMLTIPARDIFIRSLPVWLVYNGASNSNNNSGSSNNDDSMVQQLQEPLLPNDQTFLEQGGDGTTQEQTTEGGGEGATRETNEQPVLHPSPANALSPSVSSSPSFLVRLLTSIACFWTAAAVASCVESIDVVWDLLGSTLSILLSFLIPCGSYMVLVRRKWQKQQQQQDAATNQNELSNANGEEVQSPVSSAPPPEEITTTLNGVRNNTSRDDDDDGDYETPLIGENIAYFGSALIVVVFIPLMIVSTVNAVYDTFFVDKS